MSPVAVKNDKLQLMGYSIQAGAFSIVENAIKLTRALQEKGFDAFYFFDESNLYKVRFGNYASSGIARGIAEELIQKETITEYLIITPQDFHKVSTDKKEYDNLRKNIVLSAKRFLGVPYFPGGVSYETGFDCSGLTMAVYKLNGFDLPRRASEQWALGEPVGLGQLSEGDLVFFSTKKKYEISHVGIYVGSSKFIHAPGAGKKIETESILTEYFRTRFIGAKKYLRWPLPD